MIIRNELDEKVSKSMFTSVPGVLEPIPKAVWIDFYRCQQIPVITRSLDEVPYVDQESYMELGPGPTRSGTGSTKSGTGSYNLIR